MSQNNNTGKIFKSIKLTSSSYPDSKNPGKSSSKRVQISVPF